MNFPRVFIFIFVIYWMHPLSCNHSGIQNVQYWYLISPQYTYNKRTSKALLSICKRHRQCSRIEYEGGCTSQCVRRTYNARLAVDTTLHLRSYRPLKSQVGCSEWDTPLSAAMWAMLLIFNSYISYRWAKDAEDDETVYKWRWWRHETEVWRFYFRSEKSEKYGKSSLQQCERFRFRMNCSN